MLQDVILHECTPAFDVSILVETMGHLYTIHSLPGKGTISPHQLGWPVGAYDNCAAVGKARFFEGREKS